MRAGTALSGVAGVGLALGPGRSLTGAVLGAAVRPSDPAAGLFQQVLRDPEGGLLRCCAAVGMVLAARALAGVLLACGAALPGTCGRVSGRLSDAVSPVLVRRLIDLAVGVSVTGSSGLLVAGPALAATVPPPVLAPPEAVLQVWPDLARPGADVPAARVAVPPASRPSPTAAAGHTVTVHSGDCLWDLAARALHNGGEPAPAPDQISIVTDRWWQANRLVIGPDPDLLIPGQQLHPPS
jgi:hypothetical protein